MAQDRRELWQRFPDLASCLTDLDVDAAAWTVTRHRAFVFGILFDTNSDSESCTHTLMDVED